MPESVDACNAVIVRLRRGAATVELIVSSWSDKGWEGWPVIGGKPGPLSLYSSDHTVDGDTYETGFVAFTARQSRAALQSAREAASTSLAVDGAHGNITHAAAKLGISRPTLYARLRSMPWIKVVPSKGRPRKAHADA